MKKLQTERLLLRPWRISDAESLYYYARDKRVGPIAGWPAHKSVAESTEIIQTIIDDASFNIRLDLTTISFTPSPLKSIKLIPYVSFISAEIAIVDKDVSNTAAPNFVIIFISYLLFLIATL